MSDSAPTPVPAPDNTPKAPAWLLPFAPMILKAVTHIAAMLVAAIATYFGLKPAAAPAPAPVIQIVKVPVPIDSADTPISAKGPPTHFARGWIADPGVIAENLDATKTLHFSATPAGMALLAGDEDVYLWRAVRKAAGKPAPWYPNIDQGSVGDCVGAGNKHCVDVLQGIQIANGARFQWKPVSLEVIYAGSRVEIGGGRIRGDGSVGAWAKDWLQKYGALPMEKVGNYDLSNYSESRARSWGRSGVPKDLETAAKQFPVKGGALVRTWGDVDRSIRQGYPVAVCSNQGFTMTRDADGFCRASGTWAHCMAIIGVRGGAKPGGFILNSWGDKAFTGPVYPSDAPVAGFWADPKTIERMVSQGDSFALSDMQGFPSRKLPDWFVAAPRDSGECFAVARKADLFGARLMWLSSPRPSDAALIERFRRDAASPYPVALAP